MTKRMIRLENKPMQQKWLILSAVACGTFMATLDSSIVNIALPSITSAFETGISTSRWVVISYLFSITGLLLFFGKLADVIGRKSIFNLGYVVFTIGSLLCGLSHNIHQLIFARGFQGLGSAMLMANGPAVITAAFPANERGKALGTLAMVVSLGLGLGPALGGYLVKYFSWPSIFLVNIPFGILGAILAYKYIPASISVELIEHTQHFERERQLPFTVRLQLAMNRMRSFDWFGTALWMVIQIAYSVAIDRDNSLGMPVALQRIVMFGASGLLVLFIIWELGNKNPILDFNLFRSKIFLTANISALFSFIATGGIMILLPFYFQNVRGLEPHRVGMFMSLIPLTIFIVAPISGRLSDKYGSRTLSTIGMFAICLSMILMSLPHSGLASPNVNKMSIYLILVGLGVGLFQSPNNNSIMGAVQKAHLGVASALMATVRNFGLVTGTALCTGFLMYFYNVKSLETGSINTPAQNFVTALRFTFLALAILCSIGIITSFLKEDRK